MKQCPRCKEFKSESEFGKNKARKDGVSAYCAACRREIDRAYWANASPERRAKNLARAQQNKPKYLGRNRELIRKHLLAHPCIDCGENDIIVLQFDHIDPATKVDDICRMVWSLRPVKEIENEIAKCEVRCANCHMRRTAEQFGWWASVGGKTNNASYANEIKKVEIAQIDREKRGRPEIGEDTRAKMSKSHRGQEPWNKGDNDSEETRAKKTIANRKTAATKTEQTTKIVDGKKIFVDLLDLYSPIEWYEILTSKEKITILSEKYSAPVSTIYNWRKRSILIERFGSLVVDK